MNTKGFTLIELLAVIVILALLVLFATPAITSLMDKASRNSFKTEVISFVKDSEKALVAGAGKDILKDDNLISSVKASLEGSEVKKPYTYICVTLEDLVKNNVTKKDLNKYKGYVQLWMGSSKDSESYTYVKISNSKYIIKGKVKDIEDGNVEVELVEIGDMSSYSCPLNGEVIPN